MSCLIYLSVDLSMLSVMIKGNWELWLNILMFGDEATRPICKLLYRLTQIWNVWKCFIESRRSNYLLDSYITIDEQLIGLAEDALPSKPNKYGIKISLLCNVKTKNMDCQKKKSWNARPWLKTYHFWHHFYF